MLATCKVLFLVSSLAFGSMPHGVSKSTTIRIFKDLIAKNHLHKANLYLEEDDDINGHALGHRITITSATLRELNEDQMAFLLGHELAHSQFNDSQSQPKGTSQEDRADRYGAMYAHRLGYSHCKMASFFLLLYRRYGNVGGGNDPHSTISQRWARLQSKCK